MKDTQKQLSENSSSYCPETIGYEKTTAAVNVVCEILP